jgi:hypothetical protein
LEEEKNILFVTIGHNELLSNEFLFNSVQNILINKNAFFCESFQKIICYMNSEKNSYDGMLFEIYKISGNKFLIDYVRKIFIINSIFYIIYI